MTTAKEVENDVATLIGSELTQIGYENGAFVLEFGNLEIRIGSDAPIWCIVKEYTLQ